GGLFHDAGAANMTVSNCTFTGNSSGHDGGGLDDDGILLTVLDSTFNGNTAARDGGGLQNFLGTSLWVLNSTFFGNKAGNSGGRLTINDPGFVMNCTITANRVTGTTLGGGLYVVPVITIPQTFKQTLFNTIVAGNNYQPEALGSTPTPNDIAGPLDSGSA